VYVNDLPAVVNGSMVMMYADKTTLYHSCVDAGDLLQILTTDLHAEYRCLAQAELSEDQCREDSVTATGMKEQGTGIGTPQDHLEWCRSWATRPCEVPGCYNRQSADLETARKSD